ncbi:MAG: acyltransferase family protein [Ktedonobacteraceae bacterium]
MPFLHGLRGLALILVLQFHSQGAVSRLCSGRGGWWGIEIFFVLSGFLITSILLDERKRTRTINLRYFYARRFIRILPALTAYLACILIANPFKCSHPIGAVLVALFYMSDFDLVLHWGHIGDSGLDITWSLAVEEKFYAVWPVITKFLRSHLFIIAAVGIVSCIVWRAWLMLNGAHWLRICAIDTNFDGIMFGCVGAALLIDSNIHRFLLQRFRSQWISGSLFVSLLILMRVSGHPSALVGMTSKLIYYCLVFPTIQILSILLIVSLCLTSKSWVKTLLSMPILTWSGELSYGVYLWHSFAFLLIAGRVSGYLAEPVGFVLAFAFAACSYFLLEKPLFRLRRYFRASDHSVKSETADCNFAPLNTCQ